MVSPPGLPERERPPPPEEQRGGKGCPWDWALAQNLKAAVEAAPQDVVIALTGNLHTRVVKGFGDRPAYEPMGYVLKQSKPGVKVTALNVSYAAGTAWYCDGADPKSCKVRELQGALKDDKGLRVVLHPSEDGGYDGVYEVGPGHASPPASRPLLDPPPRVPPPGLPERERTPPPEERGGS